MDEKISARELALTWGLLLTASTMLWSLPLLLT